MGGNDTLGNMNMFLGMQEQLNFCNLSLKRGVYDREMRSPMNLLANESITMLVKTPNQHIVWLRHQEHGYVRKCTGFLWRNEEVAVRIL